MTTLWTQFCAYRSHTDLRRVRLSTVPSELHSVVQAYQTALSKQLIDPDNDSWDSLGPNEVQNALQEVSLQFNRPTYVRVPGNCPRCAGLGIIPAFRHIHGGRCLACDGNRNTT